LLDKTYSRYSKIVLQKVNGILTKNNFFEKNFALYSQGLTKNFLQKILKIAQKRASSSNSRRS
jgi:hypothetical protein